MLFVVTAPRSQCVEKVSARSPVTCLPSHERSNMKNKPVFAEERRRARPWVSVPRLCQGAGRGRTGAARLRWAAAPGRSRQPGRAPRLRPRTSWCAATSCAAPPQRPAGAPRPGRACPRGSSPAHARRPPRGRCARSSACRPDLDVGDERREAKPRRRVHEHRLAQRGPGPCVAEEVGGGLGVHKGQRDELGDARRRAAAERARLHDAQPHQVARERGHPLGVAEHEGGGGRQPRGVRLADDAHPLGGGELVGAYLRAHGIGQHLGRRAGERAEPRGTQRAQVDRGGLPERGGAVRHLERREGVHVHLLPSGRAVARRAKEAEVGVAVVAGVDAALHAHLGRASVPRLRGAPRHLLSLELVRRPAQLLGYLRLPALGEGAEGARVHALVRVVDVAHHRVAHAAARHARAQLVGRGAHGGAVCPPRGEQHLHLAQPEGAVLVQHAHERGAHARTHRAVGAPRRHRGKPAAAGQPARLVVLRLCGHRVGQAAVPRGARALLRACEAVGGAETTRVRRDSGREPALELARLHGAARGVARVERQARHELQPGGLGLPPQLRDLRPRRLGVDVVGRHTRRDAAPVLHAAREQPAQRRGVGRQVGRALHRHGAVEDEPRGAAGPQQLRLRQIRRCGEARALLRAKRLHDDLLHVAEARVQLPDGQERGDDLGARLADAEQDSGGEGHPQPASALDRLQPQLG
eukprot:scaffold26660_cov60-Phaeocystis_antarctica.AAC.1